MNKTQLKIHYLKKTIGKKYMVITDHIKNSFYYGVIESVVDEGHVLVSGINGQSKVSIFDLRSI